MKEIYLANGLFSEADRAFNTLVRDKVMVGRAGEYAVYLPQNNDEINDKSAVNPTAKEIFDADNFHLDNSDLVIAVLDGVEIDSGVACEIGRASALGIPVIGLVTDIRYGKHSSINSNPLYRNLYVLGALDYLATDLRELKIFVDTHFDN